MTHQITWIAGNNGNSFVSKETYTFQGGGTEPMFTIAREGGKLYYLKSWTKNNGMPSGPYTLKHAQQEAQKQYDQMLRKW